MRTFFPDSTITGLANLIALEGQILFREMIWGSDHASSLILSMREEKYKQNTKEIIEDVFLTKLNANTSTLSVLTFSVYSRECKVSAQQFARFK